MRALVVLALVLSVVIVGLWLFQRRLVYLPDRSSVPPPPDALPGAEQVRFVTGDGLTLAAWFVPARGQHRVTVLVFPGNAGNRADRAPLAHALSQHGMAVLLVDYRGYGGNPGRPSEPGLLADARAARRYLLESADVDPDGLVYYGESLGAAVALGLAVEDPPAALVLRSPFTTLAEVGGVHYPYLPLRWMLWDRYPAVDWVRQVDAPLLVVAGERDEIVPAEHSRRLFEAAGEPKRYVEVPDARHNDRALLDGEILVDAVTDFVADVVPAYGG